MCFVVTSPIITSGYGIFTGILHSLLLSYFSLERLMNSQALMINFCASTRLVSLYQDGCHTRVNLMGVHFFRIRDDLNIFKIPIYIYRIGSKASP